MTYLLLDTETTKLTEVSAAPLDQQPRILELAAVKLDDDLAEVGRVEFLVNPGGPLSEDTLKITRVPVDRLPSERPFASRVRELADFFLGAGTLVGHNLDYDRTVLLYELQRADVLTRFPWPPRHVCTVEASAHLRGYRLKLGDLHELATGARHAEAHRAMADVEALARVFRWLKKEGHA